MPQTWESIQENPADYCILVESEDGSAKRKSYSLTDRLTRHGSSTNDVFKDFCESFSKSQPQNDTDPTNPTNRTVAKPPARWGILR